jgi:hypothetical protein
MAYGGHPSGSSALPHSPYQPATHGAVRQDSGDEDEMEEDADAGGTETDQHYDHDNEADELEDETRSKSNLLPSLRDSLRKLARLLTETSPGQPPEQTDTKSVVICT